MPKLALSPVSQMERDNPGKGSVLYVKDAIVKPKSNWAYRLCRFSAWEFKAEKAVVYGKTHTMEGRRTAFFAHPSLPESGYSYAGVVRPHKKFDDKTSNLAKIVRWCVAVAEEYLDDVKFNTAIVQHYRAPEDNDGKSGALGYHTDAGKGTNLEPGKPIVSFTFTHDDPRPIRIRKHPWAKGDPTYEILPEHGSMYAMMEPMQQHYRHAVMPGKGERYSVTLRQVVVPEQ